MAQFIETEPRTTRASPARNYLFTLNNYTNESIQSVQSFFAEHCSYGVYQQEVGANGTPHLQGYMQLKKKNRITWLLTYFQAHFTVARGTPEENWKYCTKEDTRADGCVPFEHGVRGGGSGERSDLKPVVESILAKRPMSSVAGEYPEQFVKFSKGLIALAGAISEPRTWKTEVFWFYGPTGTGKSRRAYELAPGAYWKAGGVKWWDGYDGEEDVIIDDYRRDLCPFHELLRLLDRYPMRVEFKGGSCNFRARRIFITTPKCPRGTWEGRTEEDLAQLIRRIEHVENYTFASHYMPVVSAPVLAVCDLSAQRTSVVPDVLEPDSPDLFFDDPSLFNL